MVAIGARERAGGDVFAPGGMMRSGIGTARPIGTNR